MADAGTASGNGAPTAPRDEPGFATIAPTPGSNGKVFELGLVMAGAISAGAYTAGVIDFLIEALDDFERLKADPAYDGPRHTVMVPVMAGASAGGMTSAIAALQLFHEIDHVQAGADPPAPERNRLYASWVTDIGIEHLLETTDLEQLQRDPESGVVKSVLCCDVLDEIVDRAFVYDRPARRTWVGDRHGAGLTIILTVTNVRGLPYTFAMAGANAGGNTYGMFDHGDRIRFGIAPRSAAWPAGQPEIDLTAIPATATPGDAWDLLRRSALATGAFPIGLAPRVVWRDASAYVHDAKFHVPDATAGWIAKTPDLTTVGPYRFPSLDGGMIDNEPLEIARHFLARDETPAAHNERGGDLADRAVVLIDPFPNQVAEPPLDGDPDRTFGLLASATILLDTLKDQARFKPEELQLAYDPTVFSRFAITPVRKVAPDNAAGRLYPIASGALGGFSGFLHRSFRRHDYLLGRRNAQAFLRRHLVLPETAALFADHRSAIGGSWRVEAAPAAPGVRTRSGVDAQGYKLVARVERGPADTRCLPIIPLSKRLQVEIVIGEGDRPAAFSAEGLASELAARFERRFRMLADQLLDTELKHLLGNFTGFWPFRKAAALFVTSMAGNKFQAAVTAALKDIAAAFR
ncbi:patatin [Siculibacillus lacustris]|uniref:Patatin n=1 Tax=Siculibacillus lacustris TaxID=1549641 RepID=A0A4V2KU29_9HYPH|nr:patatin-like phospholipase family protein [Siculibacillus lacustris]TBW39821.1 patatin [Siculibacillus lacustris]